MYQIQKKQTVIDLELNGYRYIGDQTLEISEDLKECRSLGHKYHKISNRSGSDNLAWCPECKIYYGFDSGD